MPGSNHNLEQVVENSPFLGNIGGWQRAWTQLPRTFPRSSIFPFVIGISSRRSRHVAFGSESRPLLGQTFRAKIVIRRLFCFCVKRKLVPVYLRSARSGRWPMSKFGVRPDPRFRSVAADQLHRGRPEVHSERPVDHGVRCIGSPAQGGAISAPWRRMMRAHLNLWSALIRPGAHISGGPADDTSVAGAS